MSKRHLRAADVFKRLDGRRTKWVVEQLKADYNITIGLSAMSNYKSGYRRAAPETLDAIHQLLSPQAVAARLRRLSTPSSTLGGDIPPVDRSVQHVPDITEKKETTTHDIIVPIRPPVAETTETED